MEKRHLQGVGSPRLLGVGSPRLLGAAVPRLLGAAVPRSLGYACPRLLGAAVPRLLGDNGTIGKGIVGRDTVLLVQLFFDRLVMFVLDW